VTPPPTDTVVADDGALLPELFSSTLARAELSGAGDTAAHSAAVAVSPE
jgi:hypothetical protein